MKLLHLLFIIMTSFSMVRQMIVMSALRTQLYTGKMLIMRKCPKDIALTVAFTNW